MKQKEIFLKNEGDQYFSRNLNSWETKDIFKPYIKGNVLEIGCANGKKLSEYKANCYGIDPSSLAIANGKEKYPHLNLRVGTADKLEFSDNFFDMVIFGFCLYLVDRTLLDKVISETDRVLKRGAYLGIVDFDVPKPIKVPYKHYKGVFTYKDNYSKYFPYTLVEKHSFSHTDNRFVKEMNERISSVIMYKELLG